VLSGEAVGVQALEVVASEFATRLAVAQDVAVDDEDTMGDGADDVMFVEAKLAGSADLRLERGVPCPPVANPLGRRDCSIDRAGEAWILTRCMMSNIEALPTAVAPTNLGWSRVPDDRLGERVLPRNDDRATLITFKLTRRFRF